MTTALTHHLLRLITQEGPISIAQFMAIALTHPEHGYYSKGKVFGKEGDFVTAPEISQMFGEMVGVWCVAQWQALGCPQKVALVECGPGKGTLMADILRGTKHVTAFQHALQIHMVEASNILQKMQQQTIAPHTATWHQAIETLPDDMPIIVIANEFLDALPIHQYIYNGTYWVERMVGVHNQNLAFIDNTQPCEWSPTLAHTYPHISKQAVIEICPAANNIVKSLSESIAMQSGAMLCIDYGYTEPPFQSTLQAVKQHNYHTILEEIGNADITALVDFNALKKHSNNVSVGPIIGQGEFLHYMGIEWRAQQLLAQAANATQQEDIMSALARLTDEAQMGSLFKVFSFASHPQGVNIASLPTA